MKKLVLAVLCIFCLSALCVAADKDDVVLKARLRGVQEVPPVASAATGSFAALISADGMSITYKLTYANLNAQVLVSHIHFAFPKENGGVVVFLCGPAAGAPGGPPAGFPNPPACPDTTSGTVTGTVTAANVVGPNAQGITPAMDFAKLIQAIHEGAAYVNVHSTRSPGGEIRGQVHSSDLGHHDGDDR